MKQMKLYRRQIRPMYYSPGGQGFSDIYEPVISESDWHGEDEEDQLRAIHEEAIKAKDAWGSLKFDERYVYWGDKYLLCKAGDFPKGVQSTGIYIKD